MRGIKEVAAKSAAHLMVCYRNITSFLRDVFRAFFDIKEGDSSKEGGKKVTGTVIRRIIYGIADYWLAIFCAVANITLKVYETPLEYAFIIMWVINITIAGAFLVIYVKTGHDLSLGEDLRRGVDVIHGKSRIVGYFTTFGVILQAAVWSGPEQVVIFFRKEIGSAVGMTVIMLFLTALQTGVWMFLYRSGYDIVTS